MARRWAAVAGGLLLGLAGCGQTPPPVQEAKKIDQAKPADDELKPPPKPAETAPDARKLLDEMLAAHTGGSPDRLSALRQCSFTRRGWADTPVGRLNAVWKRDLIWPDRYRIRLETSDTAGTKTTQTFALRPGGAWMQPGDDPAPKTELAPGIVPNVKSQFHEDAVTLLFVLADPKTVAARGADERLAGVPGEKGEKGERELLGLDVWTPNGEHARLGVDKKTKLLARVVYVGQEAESPTASYAVTKELVIQDYKEVGGVKLGAKLYAKTRAKLLGEWTELTVDTTKPDPKLFDGP